jgi:endoglucanase
MVFPGVRRRWRDGNLHLTVETRKGVSCEAPSPNKGRWALDRRTTERGRLRSFLPVLCVVFAVACGAGKLAVGQGSAGPRSEMPGSGVYPLAGATFYVNPYSVAAGHVRESCSAYFPDSPPRAVAKIATLAQAVWFGDWNPMGEIERSVAELSKAAGAKDQVPILVVYNMVHRDCGEYSKGGAPDAAAYRQWMRNFAAGLGTVKAVVILEPDALSQLENPGCLKGPQKAERVELIAEAVSTIKAQDRNALIYLDAGHEGAVPVPEMARRLVLAGVGEAQGFALNTSYYSSTEANRAYGEAVSALVGGKHFVVDTGRNGRGGTADKQWCNPKGQGLGMPSTGYRSGLMDAGLVVLNPGGSDGACNGNPPAGTFSLQLACPLVQNAVPRR